MRSFFSLEVVSRLCQFPKLSHWIFISAAKFKTGSNKTQGEEEKDVDKGSISLFLQPTPPVCVGGRRGADRPLVDLVLKDVEVVGGRYSDDVLMRVPRSVKDLFAEVQAVNTDLILTTLPTYTHLEGGRRDEEQLGFVHSF